MSKQSKINVLSVILGTFLLIFFILTLPHSTSGVQRSGNTAYVPYGEKLVIWVSKSTFVRLTPQGDSVTRELFFIRFFNTGEFSFNGEETLNIRIGLIVPIKIKKVSGGIEITKPWYAVFR